ncbi:MAG: hypothetical protein ACRDTC_17875 [Pseudonocardiaceae bacterium]
MPTVDQIRSETTSRSTTMTCAVDGREHLVSDHATTAGLAVGQGRYRTVCGHLAIAAALVAPPGPRCRDCATALHRRTAVSTTSHRRRGLVARLWCRGVARIGSRFTTGGSHRAVCG